MKQLPEERKQQIKESLIATRERRKSQSIKVIELKVNCHHTSKETFAKMREYFKQAKWVTNDMIASDDVMKYYYKEHREVQRKDRDGNFIEEALDIPVLLHRGIVQQVKTDICNLSKAKNKGIRIGRLRFKSEVNSIPIITGGIKIKDRTHITIPGFKNLKVCGLDQLSRYSNYEIADGKLIQKPSGFYVKVSVCIEKNSVQTPVNRIVGLDFGIKDNIATSDGEKFNCNVRESEQLKFLQKQLHRKQKGSKRYYRLRNQIQREYEHLSNKKKDISNKILSHLFKTYDLVYFQDEQISQWGKTKKSKKGKKIFSFGKQIQSSCLGRIKAKLLLSPKGYMISKWMPTTKFCPNCGNLNTLTLSDRIYSCECGYSCDRDIHAARNIKLFGSTKRAECLEQTSAEAVASGILDQNSESQAIPMKRKPEAHTL